MLGRRTKSGGRSGILSTAGVAAILALAALTGCTDSSSGPDDAATDGAQLVSVTPAGGATGIAPTTAVRIEFDRPMADGTEDGCLLHAGGIEGPPVDGDWTWSEDHSVLTFTPHGPLADHTDHALHLGGGILDAAGHHVDFDGHGMQMGGVHLESGMMGGGMMGDGSHGGGLWEGPDGGLGWMFDFRTGS
ncbi:MAG: Ig-like domain-containing protein [Gemmatimonadota bacterium]|nr:Ig-like domain-containing protein [Gemmatimonadota bacterium]